VQSLISKYFNLKTLILELVANHVNIKVICLQEVWQVPFPDLVSIPGFSFINKQHKNNKGGGVGFYIKNDINYKILSNMSLIIEMKFESQTIELAINNKKCTISDFYRPPLSNT
jgi:exonuclease III